MTKPYLTKLDLTSLSTAILAFILNYAFYAKPYQCVSINVVDCAPLGKYFLPFLNFNLYLVLIIGLVLVLLVILFFYKTKGKINSQIALRSFLLYLIANFVISALYATVQAKLF